MNWGEQEKRRKKYSIKQGGEEKQDFLKKIIRTFYLKTTKEKRKAYNLQVFFKIVKTTNTIKILSHPLSSFLPLHRRFWLEKYLVRKNWYCRSYGLLLFF